MRAIIIFMQCRLRSNIYNWLLKVHINSIHAKQQRNFLSSHISTNITKRVRGVCPPTKNKQWKDTLYDLKKQQPLWCNHNTLFFPQCTFRNIPTYNIKNSAWPVKNNAKNNSFLPLHYPFRTFISFPLLASIHFPSVFFFQLIVFRFPVS